MNKAIDVNMSVVEIALNVTTDNFPLAVKILNKRHKFSMSAISTLTGIPRVVLYRFVERGYAYNNEDKTKEAIERLKFYLIG